MNRSTKDAPGDASHHTLCAAMGVTLPPLTMLPGPRVPMPWRDLLVHERDMTPTLEGFHRCTLALEVLRKQVADDTLMRQVLLVSDRTNRPVAFGVIRIQLESFDETSRELILACRKPLGAILGSRRIVHFSRPTRFFAVEPDATIRNLLRIGGGCEKVYGRYNELFHDPQRRLAQVIEILAPLPGEPT